MTMATFYHDVPVTPFRVMERPKNIDYRNTFTFLWDLSGADTKGCTGQPLPIGCNQEYSIQTDGPTIILGTNDEVQWHEIMRIAEAGIYTVPMVVRAIKPISLKERKTRIVVFIHAA